MGEINKVGELVTDVVGVLDTFVGVTEVFGEEQELIFFCFCSFLYLLFK